VNPVGHAQILLPRPLGGLLGMRVLALPAIDQFGSITLSNEGIMPKKHAIEIPSLQPRAVTEALRKQVRKELPEVTQIADTALQRKVVEAWAFALAHSSFKSIRDIPPAGNPDTNQARRGDQTDHLRGVTRLAVGIADEMGTAYPELAIDMDVIVAGGLVHDVGKAWEFDPINRKRWKQLQKQTGRPSIRHPGFGAHICLTVGLPEEVAHIAMAHSGEGELLVRSLECMIVHQADYTFWNTLLAGGQLKPETVPPATRKYITDKPF
jgi:putative nucleotidyltransferase with HDIG domain